MDTLIIEILEFYFLIFKINNKRKMAECALESLIKQYLLELFKQAKVPIQVFVI